jgi:hypothetical protein
MPSDRKPSPILPVAVAALLLLAAYVLSVGPAVRYWNKHGYRASTLRVAYAPVLWLVGRSETVRRVYDDYEEWWLNL